MTDVHCSAHGAQPAAYVCQHLLLTLHDSQARGFFCDGNPSELPDAWCAKCDEMLAAGGGEWTEDLGKVAGVRVICGLCYQRIRTINGV
jgi:hypothetical protein